MTNPDRQLEQSSAYRQQTRQANIRREVSRINAKNKEAERIALRATDSRTPAVSRPPFKSVKLEAYCDSDLKTTDPIQPMVTKGDSSNKKYTISYIMLISVVIIIIGIMIFPYLSLVHLGQQSRNLVIPKKIVHKITKVATTSSPIATLTVAATPQVVNYSIEKLREEMQIPQGVELMPRQGNVPDIIRSAFILSYSGQILAPRSTYSEVFLVVYRGNRFLADRTRNPSLVMREIVIARGQLITPRAENESIEIFVMQKKAANKQGVYQMQDTLVSLLQQENNYPIKPDKETLE